MSWIFPQGECDQSFGAEFVFDIHAKELIVGEIYVRIYNEQPTFPLEASIVMWLLDKLYKFRQNNPPAVVLRDIR